MTKARLTYIKKGMSDFAISRGFYFHETSQDKDLGKISEFTLIMKLHHWIYWKSEDHIGGTIHNVLGVQSKGACTLISSNMVLTLYSIITPFDTFEI